MAKFLVYFSDYSRVRKPLHGGGVDSESSFLTLNGKPRTRPTIAADAEETSVLTRASTLTTRPGYILHGLRDLWTMRTDGSNLPGTSRLVLGMEGRTVAWGILTEAVEVEESDVRTWTATGGPNVGQTVGISLENSRVSISVTAIFLTGTLPPGQGSEFSVRRSTGRMARFICLKVTWQWEQGGFFGVQIEGTQWAGSMTRLG
jgi:hypothetical protein